MWAPVRGDHVHPGRGAANEREQTNLVWHRNEDFIALAQVVFAGLENVIHGGGGGFGGFGLKFGNSIPDFALVGVVAPDAAREQLTDWVLMARAL